MNITVGSKKKNKKPIQKEFPSSKKEIREDRSINPESYLGNSPVWGLELIDLDGPWGWFNNIESKDKLREIIKKLKDFESMTWAEIKRNSKAHHHISIDNIIKKARDRLTEIKQDDLEEIFSLRLTGENRIIGKLDTGIFYIIWWDPNHEVCISNLKHT
jgi:hypothetical protein